MVVVALSVTVIVVFMTSFAKVSFGTAVAPEFEKTGGALNTDNIQTPITMDNLKGNVVLVNFWTYSCINVLRTLPYLIDWNTKYSDEGLVIVGVHTPEFEFEKNVGNVEKAVEKYGIRYPVIQDNEYKTWNAYGNNYWPRMYLVDDQGHIRYDRIGEGDYDQTEKMLQSLLSERNSKIGMETPEINNSKPSDANKTPNNQSKISRFLEQPVDFTKIKTPEMYFGYKFKDTSLGNTEGFHPEQVIKYTIPSNSSVKPNTVYLEGEWKNNPDNMELQSEFGKIVLTYSAKSVNLVAGGMGQGTVHEDNSLLSDYSRGVDTESDSQFVIDYPRLYDIVNHQSYDDDFHSLIIDVKGKGFQAFAFTFG